VTYQDLLNAANNHDISGLASKVFKREYPEWPLTLEQEAQKREDKKIFIRMALYVCLSDTYDAADEQIHWIQETRWE
jgi:hypothetical protein